MSTEQWRSDFGDGFVANQVNIAHGLSPVSLNDDEAVLRWEPTAQHFNDAGGGDFVFGGAVGVALHVGVMAGSMVVLADDEFPMTVQEEHRCYRPAKFGGTCVLTTRPIRRTRLMLWTSSVIAVQYSGKRVAELSAVSQIVLNPVF